MPNFSTIGAPYFVLMSFSFSIFVLKFPLDDLLKFEVFVNRLAKFMEALETCSILLFRDTISNCSLGQAPHVLMSSTIPYLICCLFYRFG
jgi:hypothetical protein